MEVQEIFDDIPFILLYGGVIMLNLVAALYLLLRRGNAIAREVTSPVRLRRWAAAFMLAAALSHVSWLLYFLHPSQTFYVIVCGLDILLLFPPIAGILLSMLQDRHRPVWPVGMALIPVVVLLAIYLIRPNDALLEVVVVYIIALYMLMVLIIMFFSVRRYGRWLRDNYADLENKEIWQSFLILSVFLLFLLLYNITSTSRIFLYLLQVNNILIVGLLLWRVESLQVLAENTPEEAEPEEEGHKASSPPSIPSSIGPLLKMHCEEQQLYLQHGLTLAQLAQTIGTNRYYLSQHFAQQGMTYNAYINGLRIDHFFRLYHQSVADQREITAQQLASESGFRSYSTFSATFKQKMGMTVTQWMHSTAE